MYNLTIFTSSFPYPSIKIGAMVTGIVIIGIVAYRGRNSRLRSGISWDINKVVIAVLSGIN